MARLKLLALGLIVDGTDVGETWSAFKWLEALGDTMDVTLLCLQRPGRIPTAEQLPNIRVVSWPEPAVLSRFERVRGVAQPQWPLLTWHMTRWLRAALKRGERFDIAHQLVPQAMRNRCPFRRFDIPYVIGPLGGSLETPPAFANEVPERSLAARLRGLDVFRLRHDAGLRASYERAGAVLGVAPYVRDVLTGAGGLELRRFETMLERASDAPGIGTAPPATAGVLKLLHVGRAVRTKGLRDMVRAMAQLRDLPGVTLTSAGDGEDLKACRDEAVRLGVNNRVTFLGKVSRERVEQLYATHHVFAFPSFREPMGGVFFEAMRWGLPVIAARRGGPEAILDVESGIFVDVSTPNRFAHDIAEAVRRLAADPALVERLGAGARTRLASFGSWDDKARQMRRLYESVIADAARASPSGE